MELLVRIHREPRRILLELPGGTGRGRFGSGIISILRVKPSRYYIYSVCLVNRRRILKREKRRKVSFRRCGRCGVRWRAGARAGPLLPGRGGADAGGRGSGLARRGAGRLSGAAARRVFTGGFRYPMRYPGARTRRLPLGAVTCDLLPTSKEASCERCVHGPSATRRLRFGEEASIRGCRPM